MNFEIFRSQFLKVTPHVTFLGVLPGSTYLPDNSFKKFENELTMIYNLL